MGAELPTSDDIKDDVDSGLTLFGGVTFDLSSSFSLYAEGGWGRHDLSDSDFDGTASPSHLLGGALFSFLGDAPLSPYVFGGLGVQTVKVSIEDESESDSTFGWQLGAGLGFDIGSLNAFGEGRYHSASFDEDGDLGEFDFAMFAVAVGLSFGLGGS
jgi:opacity protein-like surface antigen